MDAGLIKPFARQTVAMCGYYHTPVKEMEHFDFPFTCENMNRDQECPPDCKYYEIMGGVLHAR